MTSWDAERRARDEQRRATVMALPVQRVLRHATIAPQRADDVLIAVSVGPSDEAIALWATADDAAALASTTSQPGWATFPDPHTPRPVAAQVTVHRPSETVVTRVPNLQLAHPTVQPLPYGQVLIVAARCRWRADGPDRNAIVYDPDGRVVIEQTFGDGIEHVLTTRTGKIWVGYFDEGVYGNYGWGHNGAPAPIGATGLVRYSIALQPEWQYPADDEHGSGPISDCYALNIDGESAWACYYTDFPVVRIQDGTVAGWQNAIAHGARALAVSDTYVGLYGGYGPDRDRLVVGRMTGNNGVVKVSEHRLVLPDDSPVPPSARVVGRGAELHLLIDRDWYRFDLAQIPSTQSAS